MSRASLAIAIEDLRRLSDGAIYTAHSGQAGVTAEKRGNDTILITATCDSLQELVYSYERELKSLYQSETVVQKETKPPPSPFKWFAYGLITGVIATITVIIILKLKRKWQKQDQ
jgi:uncharacterized membrane protein YukC